MKYMDMKRKHKSITRAFPEKAREAISAHLDNSYKTYQRRTFWKRTIYSLTERNFSCFLY